MKISSFVATAALATVLASGSMNAATVFQANLLGSTEIPPNSTTATGAATVTLQDDNRTLSVLLTFSGLVAPAMAGHIHCCAAIGTAAPVRLGFSPFPASTSGTFSQTYDLTASGVLSGITVDAFLTGLRSGIAYANVHNEPFPGGQILGYLNAVPEPSTFALFALPLLALFAARKRLIKLRA